MRNRQREAIDDMVFAAGHGDFRGNHSEVWRIEETYLLENGLLEPDEPTRWSHYVHTRKRQAEFKPLERQMIREMLGL